MNYQVRVPHVFQVFPEVSNKIIANMNIISYSIHSNIDTNSTFAILEIFLPKKIDPDLTLGETFVFL